MKTSTLKFDHFSSQPPSQNVTYTVLMPEGYNLLMAIPETD